LKTRKAKVIPKLLLSRRDRVGLSETLERRHGDEHQDPDQRDHHQQLDECERRRLPFPLGCPECRFHVDGSKEVQRQL